MDPATGTFTSMDTYGGSLTDPMSLHKYLFANSNPVRYSDPSGHFSLVEFELSEAIDEILMSSISFGMANIGMVQDNQNLSETEKLAGYFAALGLGALFPFGVALLQAILPVLVAGLALAVLSLALTLTSQFAVDHEKHPIAGALLDITAGAAWGASLSCLGSAFASNARKSSELIHIEADSNATGDGCNWDDVNQEIDDWFNENNKGDDNPQKVLGGRFKDVDATRGSNEVGHHIPQNAFDKQIGISRNDGPALLMSNEDHALTRTFAGRGRATMVSDAGLSARQRLYLDVMDIRKLFGTKYNEGLIEAIKYAKSLPQFH